MKRLINYTGSIENNKNETKMTFDLTEGIIFDYPSIYLCFTIANTSHTLARIYTSFTELHVSDIKGSLKKTVFTKPQLDAYLHITRELHKTDVYNGQTYFVLPPFIFCDKKTNEPCKLTIFFKEQVPVEGLHLQIMKRSGDLKGPCLVKFSDVKDVIVNAEPILKQAVIDLKKKEIKDISSRSFVFGLKVDLLPMLTRSSTETLQQIVIFPENFNESMTYQLVSAEVVINDESIGEYTTFAMSHLDKRLNSYDIPMKHVESNSAAAASASNQNKKTMIAVPVPIYTISFDTNWSKTVADDNTDKIFTKDIRKFSMKLNVMYIHDDKRKVESYERDSLTLKYFVVLKR